MECSSYLKAGTTENIKWSHRHTPRLACGTRLSPKDADILRRLADEVADVLTMLDTIYEYGVYS
jgi:hypothetical protein